MAVASGQVVLEVAMPWPCCCPGRRRTGETGPIRTCPSEALDVAACRVPCGAGPATGRPRPDAADFDALSSYPCGELPR